MDVWSETAYLDAVMWMMIKIIRFLSFFYALEDMIVFKFNVILVTYWFMNFKCIYEVVVLN